MSKYPKIGIRPTIDGRQGGVRESLEEKTMNLAKAVETLINTNLQNGDGSPVECVIADTTIGRVGESAACATKFEREGVGATITVTSCWCYGAETMDMNPHYPKAVWGFNGTERPGAVDGGAHQHHHRPPAVNDRHRGQDRHDAWRAGGRDRQSGRAGCQWRHLCAAVGPAGLRAPA